MGNAVFNVGSTGHLFAGMRDFAFQSGQRGGPGTRDGEQSSAAGRGGSTVGRGGRPRSRFIRRAAFDPLRTARHDSSVVAEVRTYWAGLVNTQVCRSRRMAQSLASGGAGEVQAGPSTGGRSICSPVTALNQEAR